MTRLTSIPTITIETSAFDDEESGRTIFHPIIRANANGFSLGTLALNELADLHLLRRHIDQYITTLNIQDNTLMKKENEEHENPAPQFAALIEGYLMDYKPMNRYNFDPNHMVVRTSQEIILDLADMVDISLNEVAEAMAYLGYCTIVYDHKVGWLLGTASPED